MHKVCFFSGDITRSGGTERVSVMIANELKRQGNYDILFLSLTEQGKEPFFPLESGINHFSLGDRWISPGPAYLPVVRKLRRFIREQRVEVLIDIDIVLDVLSLLAARGMNTKIISWEHSNCDYEMSVRYRRLILKYSVKRTDYVVTLTEGDKKCYKERLKRQENIRTIYNPVREALREKEEKKEKWIITTGRLVPVKGIDYLAETAIRVLKNHADWKWLFLGEGEERSYLEQQIAENGLEKQLILTGRVTEVDAYLEKAQIFVLTSRSEGLPMCLLEAKAHHLPCVSFNIKTGPNEIIEDGINGYLIDPFDCGKMAEKLELLIENEELRADFAAHSQDNIEKFQMEHIIENWNEVLRQLCG